MRLDNQTSKEDFENDFESRFDQYYKHNPWRELAIVATLSFVATLLITLYDAIANPLPTNTIDSILYIIPSFLVWSFLFVYVVLKHVQNDRLSFALREGHSILKQKYKEKLISKKEYASALRNIETNYLQQLYKRSRYVRGGD